MNHNSIFNDCPNGKSFFHTTLIMQVFLLLFFSAFVQANAHGNRGSISFLGNKSLVRNIMDFKRKERNIGYGSLEVVLRKEINGVVVDSVSGEPLVGVTVKVKGSTKGTITNDKGQFNFDDIPDDAILDISFIGYRSKE